MLLREHSQSAGGSERDTAASSNSFSQGQLANAQNQDWLNSSATHGVRIWKTHSRPFSDEAALQVGRLKGLFKEGGLQRVIRFRTNFFERMAELTAAPLWTSDPETDSNEKNLRRDTNQCCSCGFCLPAAFSGCFGTWLQTKESLPVEKPEKRNKNKDTHTVSNPIETHRKSQPVCPKHLKQQQQQEKFATTKRKPQLGKPDTLVCQCRYFFLPLQSKHNGVVRCAPFSSAQLATPTPPNANIGFAKQANEG